GAAVQVQCSRVDESFRTEPLGDLDAVLERTIDVFVRQVADVLSDQAFAQVGIRIKRASRDADYVRVAGQIDGVGNDGGGGVGHCGTRREHSYCVRDSQ